jgi:hypothetical protein
MKCGSTWYPSSWGGGIRFFGDYNQSALLLDDLKSFRVIE